MSRGGVKTADVSAYLAETKGLERDYLSEVRKSEARAWWVARGASVLALASVGAVAMMLPLKDTELRVVRVNDTTGAVDFLTEMKDAQTDYGEVTAKYFLNQYVLRREGYDYYTLQNDYDTTALLSAPAVQQEYFKLYEGESARDKRLMNNMRVVVSVRSITPNPQTSTAVVRFTTENRHSDGRIDGRADWIATMNYGYVNLPESETDRRLNPLGFQIKSYRVDPEIVAGG